MKKTLLAAALLAGFATAGIAQAETSVTLYGILDTGYGYENYKLDRDLSPNLHVDSRVRKSGMREGVVNGNRWGLKGSEDLGNGLRAIFTLEAGFGLNDGKSQQGGRLFGRQAFVGLASDNWGSLTMGRQYSAGNDVHKSANGWLLGDMDRTFGGVGAGNRIDNSFKYTTPDLAGFKAIVLYGTGPDTNSTWGNGGTTVSRLNDVNVLDRGSRVSVGVLYANGPITAGASYDRQSQYGNSATGSDLDAVTNWNLNASYDFEVVKLSLAYGQDRHGKLGWAGNAANYLAFGTAGAFDPAGYSDFKSNNYHVGLSAPLGGGTLYAGWNYSTSNLDDSVADGGWGDLADNISTYQINYFYPLSKRTGVYGYASYGKNLGYVKDLKGTEAGIGLNHKF